MKKQRESLDNIIEKFKDYKIPKYLENELINIVLLNLPYVRIKGVFHKFKADKTLVLIKDTESEYFITARKYGTEVNRVVTTLIYENSKYIVERYIGIIIEYNCKTYNYSAGLIACHVYSKETGKFYFFGKGIYTNMQGRTVFFLSDQRIRRKLRQLDKYYYFDASFCDNKYLLKNVTNKYIRKLNYLDIYDLVMIYKYPKLETFYKTHNVYNVNHRKVFIDYFLKHNVEFNYKVFCAVCYTNISEYLVKLNYLGAVIKDISDYLYAYWLDLLNAGYDKKYLYAHRKDLSYYRDYVDMRVKGFENYPEYPKDIRKTHDELMSKIEINKNKELVARLKNIIKKNKNICFEYEDYKYYVPSFYDMVDYSNELNICIKSAGYIERMANGKCLLVFCEKKDNPSKLEKFAAELVKNDNGYKINQFHGFNNDAGGSSAFMQLRAKLLDALKNKIGMLRC